MWDGKWLRIYSVDVGLGWGGVARQTYVWSFTSWHYLNICSVHNPGHSDKARCAWNSLILWESGRYNKDTCSKHPFPRAHPLHNRDCPSNEFIQVAIHSFIHPLKPQICTDIFRMCQVVAICWHTQGPQIHLVSFCLKLPSFLGTWPLKEYVYKVINIWYDPEQLNTHTRICLSLIDLPLCQVLWGLQIWVNTLCSKITNSN